MKHMSSCIVSFPVLDQISTGTNIKSALIIAFVYTYSQMNRGTKTRFFFIDIPTAALPFAMILIELVTNGWDSAVIEAMGLVAAHLYYFLTSIYPAFGGGRNFITVPGFVERYFARNDTNTGYRGYGTAIRPSRPADQSSSGSGSSWTSSSSWSGRGVGRRLG